MEWTRRRAIAASAGVAVLAGCLGEDGPGDTDGSDAESDAGEADGDETTDTGTDANETDEPTEDAESILEDADLEDRTGEETVEIAVDPDGDGFDPEALEIDQDTRLAWTWEGASTSVYPLEVPPECVWDEEVDENSVDEREAGDEFDRLFWAPGAYRYASRDADGEAFLGAFRVLETEDGDE